MKKYAIRFWYSKLLGAKATWEDIRIAPNSNEAYLGALKEFQEFYVSQYNVSEFTERQLENVLVTELSDDTEVPDMERFN